MACTAAGVACVRMPCFAISGPPSTSSRSSLRVACSAQMPLLSLPPRDEDKSYVPPPKARPALTPPALTDHHIPASSLAAAHFCTAPHSLSLRCCIASPFPPSSRSLSGGSSPRCTTLTRSWWTSRGTRGWTTRKSGSSTDDADERARRQGKNLNATAPAAAQRARAAGRAAPGGAAAPPAGPGASLSRRRRRRRQQPGWIRCW